MKLPFTTQINADARPNLDEVARAAHMNAAKFAAVILQEYASLKPEFALRALAILPAEWKRRGPGRPRTAPDAAIAGTGTTTEQV